MSYEGLYLGGDEAPQLLAEMVESPAPFAGGAAPVDTLISIAVSFTGAQVVGTTFTPVAAANRAQAVATGTFSISGVSVLPAASVTWGSVTPATATISNGAGTEGQCTAVTAHVAGSGAAATTSITATVGAIVGSATLSVDVTRDATAGTRLAQSPYQFGLQTGITMAGVDGVYLCQEGSGNLASVGATAPALTANATPLYQQTAAGYSTKGVGSNGGANQRFTAASAVAPNPATTDALWLALMSLPALPGTIRQVLCYGTNNTVQQINATGAIRRATPGNAVDDSTTRPDVDDVVHPFVLLYDNTNTRTGVLTDEAKTLGVWAATTDSIKGLWGGTSPDAGCVCIHLILLTGANARLNDAALKDLVQSYGFTVPWS